MTQTARPNADDSTGGWASTESDLHSAIDEGSVSDSDYISATDGEMSGSALVCQIGLESVSDPSDHTNTKFVYRWKGEGYGDGSIAFTAALKSGSSTIVTSNPSYAGSFTTVTVNLSTSEASSISNYNDLSLVFSATDTATSGSTIAKVSWAYFECPSASGGSAKIPVTLFINGMST